MRKLILAVALAGFTLPASADEPRTAATEAVGAPADAAVAAESRVGIGRDGLTASDAGPPATAATVADAPPEDDTPAPGGDADEGASEEALEVAGGPRAEERSLDGWYVDVGGAYTLIEDSDLVDGRLPGGRGELEVDDGYAVTGAVGYGYGNGLRTELELAYRESDLDAISGGGFGVVGSRGVGGDISAFSGMVNVYYDYRVNGGFVPYIGGGIGGASIDLDSSTLGVDDSETVFAYQFMGGLRYPLNDRLWLRVGYRFFSTEDLEIQGTEAEYVTHNVEAGLTFAF
jgi:opacity protein-like surface antigen